MNDNDLTALIAGVETAPETKAKPFAESELIACDACQRTNPPTRAACLYCGAPLRGAASVVDDQANAAAPESSAKPEPGYQIVLTSAPANLSEAAIAAAAGLLDLNPPEVTGIVNAGVALPLTSASTPEHAAALREKLLALGFNTAIVADQDLSLENPINRVRAIEVSPDALTCLAVSGSSGFSVRWDEIVLIVAGRLVVNRVEVEERQRRGRKQLVDTRELFADESVLDFYGKSEMTGCRIVASNFDFSGLGAAKTMTTFLNFKALVDLLRSRAVNAEFDEAYVRLRPVLASVWPIEPQTRRGEWRRSGAGKVDVATVTTTDNEAQFTRYSRLRRCLRQSENET